MREYRFRYDSDEIRVVIAGDVLCIPGYPGHAGWSMGGFGSTIDETWLLAEGNLPGTATRRRALASMLVRAVRAHYGKAEGTGDGVRMPRGPFVRCPTCRDSGVSGFVLSPEAPMPAAVEGPPPDVAPVAAAGGVSSGSHPSES